MSILAAAEAATQKIGLATPDYIILVGYFVLMIGIGLYFYRYMKQMKDYFTGGNTIPWWLSGVSFYMASFSVFTFVALGTVAYNKGAVSITLIWFCVWGTIFGVLFFARKWRRARITSPVEYLEHRYSPVIRQLFAWEGLPVRIIDDSLKLVALGTFVSGSMGFPLKWSILGSSLVVLGYTMSGGLWAVMVTDFVQFIVLLTALLVLCPLAIGKAGGVAHMFEGYPKGFFNFFHKDYDMIYMIAGVLLYILAYSSVNWALIQRYYCVPKERDSVKMGVFVTILFLACQPLILLPAMLSHKFMPLPEGFDDKLIYVTMCMKLLPPGMMGLVVAAMFAATISMLSGDCNVCASVLTNDVYKRYIRPNAPQKELVLAGRLATLVVGLISLGVAFLMLELSGEGLFKGMMKLFSIFTPPVAVSMISGLLFKRASSKGSLCGFILGVATGLTLFFVLGDEKEIFGWVMKKESIILFGSFIVTCIGLFIGSEIFRQKPDEMKRVDDFFMKLNTPIGQLEEDAMDAKGSGTQALSPFRIVGICVALTAVLLMTILPYLYKEGGTAFKLDLGISVGLMAIGCSMAYFSKFQRKQKDQ